MKVVSKESLVKPRAQAKLKSEASLNFVLDSCPLIPNSLPIVYIIYDVTWMIASSPVTHPSPPCYPDLLQIEIHASLDHPSIVKFYDYWEDEKNVYILMVSLLLLPPTCSSPPSRRSSSES